jgi:sugar phosphate isomerase/epimerase
MTLDGIPGIKGGFPFRVGTTSYIIPADILPNVRTLAPLVDDIELLIFETPDVSNLPSADTIDELNALARKSDLTYTVHLPLNMGLGSRDEATRRHAVMSCQRVIDVAGALDPFAYILHLDTDEADARDETPSDDLPAWTRSINRSVQALLATGVDSRQFCVETLAYRFEYAEPIITENDLSVCLDIGHLALYGYDVREHIDRNLPRTRVMHAHGVKEGRDHRGLDQVDPALLDYAIDALTRTADVPRVLTLEVFAKEKFERSIRVMHERLACGSE